MTFFIGYKRKIFINTEISYEDFVQEYFSIITDKFDESINYKQNKNILSFSGRIFRFAWNGWYFMNGITKGEIEINETPTGSAIIEYKLYFTEFFIISLVFSMIPISFWNVKNYGVMIAACIWGGFYFGNMAISIFRFGRFMKKSLIKYYETNTFDILNENETEIQQA